MDTFSALLALCEGNSLVTGESLHNGQWGVALMIFLHVPEQTAVQIIETPVI